MRKETSYDRFLRDINVVKPRVQRPPKETKRPEPPPVVQLFENPKQLLTVNQVAEVFAVSIHCVYRWIRMGQLPASRLPGSEARTKKRIRIVAADVNALMRPVQSDASQGPHF